METYGLQKITLLREISLKTGIQVGPALLLGPYGRCLWPSWVAEAACGSPQVLLKEYSFDSRHKPAFTEEDVLNIFPVVKHVNPKASDAFHFFQSGQAKVQQGAWPGVAGGWGVPQPGPDFATLVGALQAS